MAESPLRKMLKPARILPEADPAVDGLAGVLGKSASVAGLDVLRVQLEAQSRGAQASDPENFVASLPENGLFFALTCGVDDQIALISLDFDLFNAIADVVTGRIENKGADTQRPPTAIDAALCRPYLDALLGEFAEILRALRGGQATETYLTAKVKSDPSPHMFPEMPYLKLAIGFDISDGARQGEMSILMPARHTEFTSTLPRPGENTQAWQKAFRKTLDGAPVAFDVVLHRKKMPLRQILRLQVGDVLEIPAKSLEALSIESRKGAFCQKMMQARLGEYQEMRAAKITSFGPLESKEKGQKLLTTELVDPPAAIS